MSNPDGNEFGLSTDELRAAVRAVLRDVLPVAALRRTGEGVVLATDADLDAFVRRLAGMCADPDARAELQEGRHGFRLATEGVSDTSPATTDVVRVERGAVTELAVARAAADGARLVLGRSAVLTPLARDKARSLGVAIEREES